MPKMYSCTAYFELSPLTRDGWVYNAENKTKTLEK